MKKILAILLLITAIGMSSAFSQTNADTARKIAIELDLKNFKLDKPTMAKFRQHHFAATSDYFKPGKYDVSDTTLLNDSAYVKAYRAGAYQKTKHRRTTGHTILVIGSITAGLIIIIAFLAGASAVSSININ